MRVWNSQEEFSKIFLKILSRLGIEFTELSNGKNRLLPPFVHIHIYTYTLIKKKILKEEW